MSWSAVWVIWRDYTLALVTALAAAMTGYWDTAPDLLRLAAVALGPLLMLEAVSAAWMQRAARQPRTEPVEVTVFSGDTWSRAGQRFGLTLLLVALAGAVDVILGTRHMTVLWVLLWGVSGHVRATLRHLEVVAQLLHMKLPIFPDDRLERLDALTTAEPKGEEEER